MTNTETARPSTRPPSAEDERIRAKPIGVAIVIAALVGLVLAVVGAAWWLWTGLSEEVKDFSQTTAQPFVDRGYTRVDGQVLSIWKDVDEPTLYLTQMIELGGTHNADVAVIGQILTISGTVNGDVDFLGQQIFVKRGGVVTGDIRCSGAESVSLRGRVDGDVVGAYGRIDDQRSNASKDASKDESEDVEPDVETEED